VPSGSVPRRQPRTAVAHCTDVHLGQIRQAAPGRRQCRHQHAHVTTCRAKARGSAPQTSASPPVLTSGNSSAQTARFSSTRSFVRHRRGRFDQGHPRMACSRADALIAVFGSDELAERMKRRQATDVSDGRSDQLRDQSPREWTFSAPDASRVAALNSLALFWKSRKKTALVGC